MATISNMIRWIEDNMTVADVVRSKTLAFNTEKNLTDRAKSVNTSAAWSEANKAADESKFWALMERRLQRVV